MERITLSHHSRFSPQQLFDLIADIARYDEFVPYCVRADILERVAHGDSEYVRAELHVAYKFIHEHYVIDVVLSPAAKKITTRQYEGSFAHLFNQWQFVPDAQGCVIEFMLEFDFRVPLLARIISPLMGRAVDKMIAAFETRAHQLYD